MKKFLCLTTSLCAAVCALSFGGAVAFAEADEGAAAADKNAEYYPATFKVEPSFGQLDDYAVGDDGTFLFLENNQITEYGSEDTVHYTAKNDDAITNLYFQGGEFYYRQNDKVYALKNIKEPDPKPKENFESTVKTNDVTLNGFHYYFNLATGVLKVNNLSTDEITSLDGFLNLKQYGDNAPVYAIRTTDDNKQVLCTLKGTTPTDVKVNDFDLTKKIEVGNAYNAMAASAEQTPKTVKLKGGAYMTEVYLDELPENSTKFITGNTVKTDETTALLLYSAGDATYGISVIAVNGKTYLVHPKDAQSNAACHLVESDFTEGTATEGFIYSAPYESNGTRIRNLPYGAKVTILKEIKMADNAELDHDFYYVEYKVDEETTVKGFVRFGLISTYTFNEDPPTETPDPEETYEDLIKPVVLILLVILLIAIAAGYLIYVGTSDKRKIKSEAASTDATKRDKK